MTVVCCKWSCIMCRQSSRARRRPALDSARMRLSLRRRSIPSMHCSTVASIEWSAATGRDWKSCCCSWSPERGRRKGRTGAPHASEASRKKRRQACRLGFRADERVEARGSPEDLCPGLSARPALRLSLHFEGLSHPLSFSRRLSVPRFPVLFGGLTACATFDCTRFTQVHVDREVRCWIGFLALRLVIV